jgi:hypothetical protein
MGKLHNDEDSDLSNMIRMIRSRRKRADIVICMGEKTYIVLGGETWRGETIWKT